MKNIFSMQYYLLFILVLSMPLTWASDDHVEARLLSNSGEIIPLDTILKNLRINHPGIVLDVELEREDTNVLYEVEILDINGIVKEIYINARTGDVLYVKEDD